MADTVVSQLLGVEPMRRVLHIANISDGTGESAVAKTTKAGLLVPTPGNPSLMAAPTSIDIEWVRWNIQGFSSVRIYWDHTTDDLALVLAGSGFDDFDGRGPLADPRSAGGPGDIIVTTAGAAAGATYDISLGLLFRF